MDLIRNEKLSGKKKKSCVYYMPAKTSVFFHLARAKKRVMVFVLYFRKKKILL